MENLTTRSSSGIIHLKDQSEQGHIIATKKLFDYESTGFEPEELREMTERNTPLIPRKADEQPYFRKHFHTQCCPHCNHKLDGQWNFCPKCGQKIRRKE